MFRPACHQLHGFILHGRKKTVLFNESKDVRRAQAQVYKHGLVYPIDARIPSSLACNTKKKHTADNIYYIYIYYNVARARFIVVVSGLFGEALSCIG